MHFIVDLISAACAFLWGDLITIPLPGGGSLGLSMLLLLLLVFRLCHTNQNHNYLCFL